MYQRRTIDRNVRKSKLEELADACGIDVDELLENAAMDSAVPGICTTTGCDYSAEYEPDQDAGWCEECNAGTVASALILAGVI